MVQFQSQLNKKCFMHFNTYQIFSQQTKTLFLVYFAIEALCALKINFVTCFSDFYAVANDIKIFQKPFIADGNDLSVVQQYF